MCHVTDPSPERAQRMLGHVQLHCGGPGMTWEALPLEWAPRFQRHRGHSCPEGRGRGAGFICLRQGELLLPWRDVRAASRGRCW